MAQQATAQKLPEFNESLAARIADEPTIDLVHLSRQTLGDVTLEIELLRLFDEQARGYDARLRAPAEPGRETLARLDLAHTMKGSSRAIGAFALGDAAEHYETALRSGAADAGPALRRVLEALDRARTEVSRLL